jgi:hypothetical protein
MGIGARRPHAWRNQQDVIADLGPDSGYLLRRADEPLSARLDGQHRQPASRITYRTSHPDVIQVGLTE